MGRYLVVFMWVFVVAGCNATWGGAQNNSAAPSTASNPQADCKMGSDGEQVCGYDCMMGSDGRVACADTPDGKCAMSTNGRISCTQLRSGRYEAPTSTQAECKMGSDGQQVCGYDCMMGSDGRVACADTPDGKCARSTNGRISCTSFR